MDWTSGDRRRLRTRGILFLALFWLAAGVGCGDGEKLVVAYEERIQGEVLLPTGDPEGIPIEAVTFDEDAPYVYARTRTDEDGEFQLFLPAGEYRVSMYHGVQSYYGNGGARALEAQATPVSAGRGIETPYLTLALGRVELDVELPGPADEWSVSASLRNAVLHSRIANGSGMSSGEPNVARFSFPPVALDQYRIQLAVSSRSTNFSDIAFATLEVDGITTHTIETRAGETTVGRTSVPGVIFVRGTFVGPAVDRVDAKLSVALEDAERDTPIRSVSLDLSETTEFEFPLLFERDLRVRWTVSLPSDGNDETDRWLGSWTKQQSTTVRPALDPEPIRLESIGIDVEIRRPDAPGVYAGWLEIQDETGRTRGSYYTDDRSAYQGPVFFSNLPLGRYYLKYRRVSNSPALEQWYGDGRTLSFENASPIEALSAGTLAQITWTPFTGGSIAGTATLEDGTPAAGHGIVLAEGNSTSYGVVTSAEDTGGFAIAGLSNGTYRIGVVDRDTSEVTWYPGTADLAEAEFIEIVDYEAREGFDLRMVGIGGLQRSSYRRSPGLTGLESRVQSDNRGTSR